MRLPSRTGTILVSFARQTIIDKPGERRWGGERGLALVWGRRHSAPMADDQGTIQRSGLRKWLSLLFGVVCFGFAPAVIFWAWNTSFFARAWLYVVAPVIGAILIAHWYLIFGRAAMMTRLKRFAVFAMSLGLLAMLGAKLLRYEGSTGGSSFPKFVWRWSPETESAAVADEAIAAAAATDDEQNGAGVQAEIDSPQLYGPNRDGRVVTEGALDWTASPPLELWRRPIGLGWSGFAVVGSRALTQEQRGGQEWVSCYDLGSGELLWKHADEARFDEKMSGPGPRATPTVRGDRLWTMGATGILNCLDLASGELVWTRNILQENGAENLEWGKSASPLWVDDMVVVSGGNHRGSLLAYDAASGEPKWSFDGDGASYASPTLIELDGIRQIVSLNRINVSGHIIENGQMLWKWDWPGVYPKVGQPMPVGADRLLLTASYGAGSHLLEVKMVGAAGKGAITKLWDTNRLKTKFSSATVIDGYAYGLDEGIFACIDLSDGSKVWKGGRYGFGQQLLINGDTFLVQTERGRVVLLAATPEGHRELGELAGLEESGGTSWNPPTLAGRYLLLRNDREAVCYFLGVRS